MKIIKITLVYLFLSSCNYGSTDPQAELTGGGYAHYHIYPDVGTCSYGNNFDFTQYNKMVAAVSESIHRFYGNQNFNPPKYLRVTSESTGAQVIVRIVDIGGGLTDNFNLREHHIMDLSQEAFQLLDVDGVGYQLGRIYIRWEIFSEDPGK